MIQGKVHPTELDPIWNYNMRPMPDSVEFRLLEHLQTQTLKEGIDNTRSEMPIYHELRKWFIYGDSLQKAGGEIVPIEYPGTPLRLGDSSRAVALLKDHLASYGYEFSDIESGKLCIFILYSNYGINSGER